MKIIQIIKLSVFAIVLLISLIAKADSLFLSENIQEKNDNITQTFLIYIKDMEFYNHKSTAKYTDNISEKISLDPHIVVTNDENLADYILYPKLLRSHMEKIDANNNKYSISLSLELQKKDTGEIKKTTKNRYIIVEQDINHQEIVHRLVLKLLGEAIIDVIYNAKNFDSDLI